jgi:hypothetical protein
MRIKTLILALLILTILGINIGMSLHYYNQMNDQMHANDRVLQQFMIFIVSNHPSYFDQRYTDLSNWAMQVPGDSSIISTSGLLGAEMHIDYNANLNYFGHLEANTTEGLFIWNGVLWVNNYSVSEISYYVTG